jgi:hypothetical protein
MRVITCLTAAVLAVAPSIALADTPDEEKYVFWHHASASRAQVLADFGECRDLASDVQPPAAGYIYTPNLAAAAVGGLLQGFMKGAQRRHMFDAALRKCLYVKGFTRHAMTREQSDALYAGKWDVTRERIADRAVAPLAGEKELQP